MAREPLSNRGKALWAVLALAMILPPLLAAFSPYLAYRSAAYIAAGFAGIAALSLLLIHPLLGAKLLPGLNPRRAGRWHAVLGQLIVVAVLVHLAGLYLTSPADTLDALVLVSPTPFSVYGVAALLALLASAALVTVRRRLGLTVWRWLHRGLGAIVIVGSVLHAVLIEGTMEPLSKLLICAAAIVVGAYTLIRTTRGRRGLAP